MRINVKDVNGSKGILNGSKLILQKTKLVN
jgi:hypothetical protein